VLLCYDIGFDGGNQTILLMLLYAYVNNHHRFSDQNMQAMCGCTLALMGLQVFANSTYMHSVCYDEHHMHGLHNVPV